MPDSKDEVFAFGRTLSRLLEMRSHEYLVRSTRLHEAAANAFMLIDRQGVLTHAEAGELFKAYDVDASGYLERPEMRLLMEDLSERRKGHRHVLDEEVDALFGMMDVDDNGYVSIHEFCEVFVSYGPRYTTTTTSVRRRGSRIGRRLRIRRGREQGHRAARRYAAAWSRARVARLARGMTG